MDIENHSRSRVLLCSAVTRYEGDVIGQFTTWRSLRCSNVPTEADVGTDKESGTFLFPAVNEMSDGDCARQTTAGGSISFLTASCPCHHQLFG